MNKPLGIKAYGSIPHLPGSRLGQGDHCINDGQARMCTEPTRHKIDRVIVEEKLDGSCVSVAKVDGEIIPLGRAGYPAITSKYEQHHRFHDWVMKNKARFDARLDEGERIVGEWLWQAHGTIYNLPHEPFVAFDFMVGHQRFTFYENRERLFGFVRPRIIHQGGPVSVETIIRKLDPSGHGAKGPAEGAVWRLEKNGKLNIIAKWVRSKKQDGCYLPELSGKDPVFNSFPAESEVGNGMG